MTPDSPRRIMLEAICCREIKRRMKRPCGTDGIYCRDCCTTIDDEILPALEKAGLMIVPKEPTNAMKTAGDNMGSSKTVWRAMAEVALAKEKIDAAVP